MKVSNENLKKIRKKHLRRLAAYDRVISSCSNIAVVAKWFGRKIDYTIMTDGNGISYEDIENFGRTIYEN